MTTLTGPNQITLDPLWRSPLGANVNAYKSLPILLTLSGVLLLRAPANLANLLRVRSAPPAGGVRRFLLESLWLALAAGGWCY